MKTVKVLLLITVIVLICASYAFSEIRTEISGTCYTGDTGSALYTKLRFGDTFNPFENGYIKWNIEVSYSTYENKINLDIKKLYLKYKLKNLHISIGRIPVSWNFGSISNPFNFYISDKNEWIDGISTYFFLGEESTLNIVYGKDNKWGLRLRTTISGYDMSLNFVSGSKDKRIGLTFKGDIGEMGIYGGMGYDFSGNSPFFLLGGDYSYYFKEGSKIYLQAEYTNKGNSAYFLPILASDTQDNILFANTTYIIDEFSNVSLGIMHNFTKNGTTVIPAYQSQINDNLSYKIGGMFYIAHREKLQKGLFFEIDYIF